MNIFLCWMNVQPDCFLPLDKEMCKPATIVLESKLLLPNLHDVKSVVSAVIFSFSISRLKFFANFYINPRV